MRIASSASSVGYPSASSSIFLSSTVVLLLRQSLQPLVMRMPAAAAHHRIARGVHRMLDPAVEALRAGHERIGVEALGSLHSRALAPHACDLARARITTPPSVQRIATRPSSAMFNASAFIRTDSAH